MADVAEENSLGTVQLRQRLKPAACVLKSAHTRNAPSNGLSASHQELLHGRVQLLARIYAHHNKAERLYRCRSKRNKRSFVRRFRPSAGWNVREPLRQIGH